MNESKPKTPEEFTETEFYVCDCGNPEHNIISSHDRYVWGGIVDEDFSLHVQMSHYIPWYKRILVAIRYILGMEVKNYHYAETLLSVEEAERLRDSLNKYIDSPYSMRRKVS